MQKPSEFHPPLLTKNEKLYEVQFDLVGSIPTLRFLGASEISLVERNGKYVMAEPKEKWRTAIDFAPKEIHVSPLGAVAAFASKGPLVFFDANGKAIRRWEGKELLTGGSQILHCKGFIPASLNEARYKQLKPQRPAVFQGTVLYLQRYVFVVEADNKPILFDPTSGERIDDPSVRP